LLTTATTHTFVLNNDASLGLQTPTLAPEPQLPVLAVMQSTDQQKAIATARLAPANFDRLTGSYGDNTRGPVSRFTFRWGLGALGAGVAGALGGAVASALGAPAEITHTLMAVGGIGTIAATLGLVLAIPAERWFTTRRTLTSD